MQRGSHLEGGTGQSGLGESHWRLSFISKYNRQMLRDVVGVYCDPNFACQRSCLLAIVLLGASIATAGRQI